MKPVAAAPFGAPSDWTMAWTIKAGRVTSFRSCEDTFALAAAFSA
jgi:ketosteroid isomerase-like protein